MSNIIEFKNVSYSYDGKGKALDNVSFSIGENERTVIVGHNGSGKSTIAKLVCGLLDSYEGEIYLFGEKVTKNNIDRLRTDVGIVFQNPDNQFVGATVEDDIAFGLENKRIKREDMKEMIIKYSTSVGMNEYLNKEPSNLSGGQKQRVAIASILALNSKILILDEATTMLDPAGKEDINNLINKIKEDNPSLSLISITHNVDEVVNADKIIVLNKGTIFYAGTLDEFVKLNLKEIGLKKPFLYEVADALNSKGVKVSANSESELIDALWQLSSHK